MKVVRYGRSTTGATSDAYAGVTLWNAPQGIPGHRCISKRHSLAGGLTVTYRRELLLKRGS
jgi:hypothetical protein